MDLQIITLLLTNEKSRKLFIMALNPTHRHTIKKFYADLFNHEIECASIAPSPYVIAILSAEVERNNYLIKKMWSYVRNPTRRTWINHYNFP